MELQELRVYSRESGFPLKLHSRIWILYRSIILLVSTVKCVRKSNFLLGVQLILYMLQLSSRCIHICIRIYTSTGICGLLGHWIIFATVMGGIGTGDRHCFFSRVDHSLLSRL